MSFKPINNHQRGSSQILGRFHELSVFSKMAKRRTLISANIHGLFFFCYLEPGVVFDVLSNGYKWSKTVLGSLFVIKLVSRIVIRTTQALFLMSFQKRPLNHP